MKNTCPKMETKRIFIFLLITFGLSWGWAFGVVWPMAEDAHVTDMSKLPAVSVQLAVAAMMFFPAVGVVLTRLITREGFGSAWLRPHLRGNGKTYLLAWFGPGLLTVLGTALYFLLFPGKFDPELGYLKGMLAAAGEIGELPMPWSALLLVQTVQALILAPVLNFVPCFGEEWGWRGYLLPKMKEKLPTVPMLLLTGVIWGLWHAPITALGHNYGVGYPGFPWTGIAAMCGFCIMLGIFFSYLTLKTGSCIPAVLAHGAVNGCCALGVLLTADGGDPFIGPAPTGIVGAVPFLVLAAVCLWRLTRTASDKSGTAESAE